MNSDPTVQRPGISPRAKQILIGIAGALVLFVFALLIYSVLVTPERQPYRDALAQYQKVYDANVGFTNAAIALNGTLGTEEQIKANKEAIENAKSVLQAQTAALGELPVMKEGDGKALYDTFSEKVKKYISYNDSVLESRQKVRPVLTGSDCSKALASTEQYAQKLDAMRACAKAFEDLNDISDVDYRQLVESYAEKTGKLAAIYQSIADLKDPSGNDKERQDELVAEHDDVLASIETVNTTFASDLQRHKAEVDITASAQSLDAYLTRKSSIF